MVGNYYMKKVPLTTNAVSYYKEGMLDLVQRFFISGNADHEEIQAEGNGRLPGQGEGEH